MGRGSEKIAAGEKSKDANINARASARVFDGAFRAVKRKEKSGKNIFEHPLDTSGKAF